MHLSLNLVVFFPFLAFSTVAAHLEPWDDNSFDTSLYARSFDDQHYIRDTSGENLLPRTLAEDEYLVPRGVEHPQTIENKLLALHGDIMMMNKGKLPTSVQRLIPGAPYLGDFTPEYADKHRGHILKVFYDGQDEHNQDIKELEKVPSRRKEAKQYREAADLWAKTFGAHFVVGLHAHKDAKGEFSAGGEYIPTKSGMHSAVGEPSRGGGRTRQGTYGEEGTSGTAKDGDSDTSGPRSSRTIVKTKGSGLRKGFFN